MRSSTGSAKMTWPEACSCFIKHPDALEARVQSAIERIRAKLRKLSCAVELLSIEDGAVRVQLTTGGHGCGSSTREVCVENGIYELAPDVGSLEILGLEEPTSTGFVALETLTAGAGRNENAVLAGGTR